MKSSQIFKAFWFLQICIFFSCAKKKGFCQQHWPIQVIRSWQRRDKRGVSRSFKWQAQWHCRSCNQCMDQKPFKKVRMFVFVLSCSHQVRSEWKTPRKWTRGLESSRLLWSFAWLWTDSEVTPLALLERRGEKQMRPAVRSAALHSFPGGWEVESGEVLQFFIGWGPQVTGASCTTVWIKTEPEGHHLKMGRTFLLHLCYY